MRTLAVIWRSAGLLMASDARSIVEVLPPVSWRAAPGTPEWVRGLVGYRGGLIPLVDSGTLLGTARAVDRMSNRVIVLRIGGATGAAVWPVGLWVESVLEIEPLEFGDASGHPGFATEGGRFLGPVAQTRWGQVQLVKPEEIFTPEQARIMTQRLEEAAA